MKWYALFFMLLAGASLPVWVVARPSQKSQHFLFYYFSGIPSDSTGNGQDGLHMAFSRDWSPIGNPQQRPFIFKAGSR